MKKEKIWIKDYSGDLAYLMNLQGLVTETAPGINIKTSCQTKHEKKLTSYVPLPMCVVDPRGKVVGSNEPAGFAKSPGCVLIAG